MYRQNGAPSMVIDIRLTNDIDAAYLQQSVYKSLQRYPYLTSQLVEKMPTIIYLKMIAR